MDRTQPLVGSADRSKPVVPPTEEAGALGVASAVRRRLLRMPLYYKLVIANSAIALIAVSSCAWLVASAVRVDPGAGTTRIILPITLAVVGLGGLVNAFVLRLALAPLRHLEEAAERVRAGIEEARATEVVVSDAGIDRVVRTFNTMLDSLSIYRQRLREIASRALDAGEAERKRISGELHDSVAQSLAAILVQLRLARAGASPEQSEQLVVVSDQLAGVIEDLRGLAQRLRPPALDMLGLGPAVLAHARSISETTGVRVEAQVNGMLDGALSTEAELVAYRLVQEALLNVVRHAQTNNAWVEVRQERGVVVVEVSDHGLGFDLEPALANGALGLLGMYERAAHVGGRVGVRSTPGQGTTVNIEIPLEKAPNV